MSVNFSINGTSVDTGETLTVLELAAQVDAGKIPTYTLHLVFQSESLSDTATAGGAAGVDRSRVLESLFRTKRMRLTYSLPGTVYPTYGKDQVVDGYVESFNKAHQLIDASGKGFVTWRIVLRPLYGLLNQKRRTRVFRNLTAYEILILMLEDLNVNLAYDGDASSLETYLSVAGEPDKMVGLEVDSENDLLNEPIDFIMQNDELDYSFLSRLLYRVGYYLSFSSRNESALKLVRYDAASSLNVFVDSGATGGGALYRQQTVGDGVLTRAGMSYNMSNVGGVFLATHCPAIGEDGETIGMVGASADLAPLNSRQLMVTNFSIAGFNLETPIANKEDLQERYLNNRLSLESARFNAQSEEMVIWTRQLVASPLEEVGVYPRASGGSGVGANIYYITGINFEIVNSASSSLLPRFLGEDYQNLRLSQGNLYPEMRTQATSSPYVFRYRCIERTKNYFPFEKAPEPNLRSSIMGFVCSYQDTTLDWDRHAQPDNYGNYGVIIMGADTYYKTSNKIERFSPLDIDFMDENSPLYFKSIDENIACYMQFANDFSGNTLNPHSGIGMSFFNGTQVLVGFIDGDVSLPYVEQSISHNMFDQTPSRLQEAVDDVADFYRFI